MKNSRLSPKDVFLMENHSTAIAYWNDSDSLVVSLDAHPDIGWVPDDALSRAAGMTGAELLELESDTLTYTQPGVFDITNFLGLALARSLIKEVWWVVPDWIWYTWERTGDVAQAIRRRIGKWTQGVTPEMTEDIRYDPVRPIVRARLPHGLLTVSPLRALTSWTLQDPWFLSIDLDFLANKPGVGEDRLWLQPNDLVEALPLSLPPRNVTIACSVHGGYTPLEFKEVAFTLFCLLTGECRSASEERYIHYRSSEIPDRFPPESIRANDAYWDFVAGSRAMVKEEPDQARVYLSSACAADPDVAGYHYVHALSLWRTGEPESAERALRHALSLQDGFYMMYSDLAVILASDNRRLGEAVELLECAVRICPQCADVYANLGRIQSETGDLDRAVQTLRKALRINPIHPEASLALGRLLIEEDPVSAHEWLSCAARFAEKRGILIEALRHLHMLASQLGVTGVSEKEGYRK